MYSRHRKISYLIISLLWRTDLGINALPADRRAAIVRQNAAPPALLTLQNALTQGVTLQGAQHPRPDPRKARVPC